MNAVVISNWSSNCKNNNNDKSIIITLIVIALLVAHQWVFMIEESISSVALEI